MALSEGSDNIPRYPYQSTSNMAVASMVDHWAILSLHVAHMPCCDSEVSFKAVGS